MEASGAAICPSCLFPTTTTMQLQPARWDKGKLPASDDDDSSRPCSPSPSPGRSDASARSLPLRMRLKEKKPPFEFRVIKQASATPSHSSSAASTDKELVPIPSPPWAKSKPLPPPSTGQKRRYSSDDESDRHAVRGRRMDIETNGRDLGMNADKRRREDLEREREREMASRTLPPLPPFRPGHQGGRILSYPGPSFGPPPLTSRPPPAPPRGYSEYTSPPYPYPPPVRYPPQPSSHPYHSPPPSTYRSGPSVPANFLYPQPYPPGPYPPLPPRSYAPPPRPPQQAPPLLQPPPPKQHQPLPPNRNRPSTSQTNEPPPAPPPPPHSQLLPSSTPYSYFHKIRLNKPSKPRGSSSSKPQPQPQAQEYQQQEQNNQTLYQQAAAARHAAYSSPGTVDSTTLTTHPVPYSIGVKAASSTAGMAGDAGRLVGEYEQHPLRQQTSYLPISAVGGAQFVLKPPRVPKTKASKLKFMMSGPAPTSVLPLASVSRFPGAVDNFVPGGIETVVEPRPFQPHPDDVLIEIKQEEVVTASVAAITIAEVDEHMSDVATSDEEDELATPAVDDAGEEYGDKEVGRNAAIHSLGSPPDFLSSETNTFAAPERPSPPIPKSPKQGQSFMHAYPPIAPGLQSPVIVGPDSQTLPGTPPTREHSVEDSPPSTTMNKSPHLTNGHFRQATSISFVEFRPPPPPNVKNVPSNPRPAPSANGDGPAPMSSFTSTFPAQPPHLRQPRARTEYRVRYNAPLLPPRRQSVPLPGPDVLSSPPPESLSVQVHVSPAPAAARARRGPKPRRNDFDAVLDPSQTAAQGGQIRMRVLPQATYTPPVQPALAIMHEQPQVAKRKGKRTDGLVPEYGFVPREYVYRERE